MLKDNEWVCPKCGRVLGSRCFLAPEPEVPLDIGDLVWKVDTPGFGLEESHNREIIEAFRRGQNSAGKTER